MGERDLSNQIRRISQLVDRLSQVDRYCRVESWLFFPDMFDPFLAIMAYNVVVFLLSGCHFNSGTSNFSWRIST